MVASGVTAVRASVVLRRSLARNENSSSLPGSPFQTDAQRKRQREHVFEQSDDRVRLLGHAPDSYE